MAVSPRVIVVACLAGLMMWGLGLGAESQREVFLEPDYESADSYRASAAGNVVTLTSLLCALGAAWVGALLSPLPVARRFAPAAGLFLSTYVLALFVQTAWPNYDVNLDARSAYLSNTLIAANQPAVPSLLLPIMAIVAAGILGAGVAWRALAGKSRRDAPLPALLRFQVAAIGLAVPFLAVAAWGNLRLLVGVPSGEPGLGPYLAALPLAALLCLGLVAVMVLKTWRLGSYLLNSRLAGATRESWVGLGRIELGIMAALAGIAVLASFLPRADLEGLQMGRTFVVTLRGHTQFLIFLLIPLAPLRALHRTVLTALDEPPRHAATLEPAGAHPWAIACLAAVTATCLFAALATWAFPGALWAWILACIPMALLLLGTGDGESTAPVLLLCAYACWAVGNTIVASYNGTQASALSFRDAPGLLGLWRALAAALGALAAYRLLRGASASEPPQVAVPLSLGAALAMAGVALLEMPLSAWLINHTNGDAIAVGSIVSSQSDPIQATMHIMATLFAVAASVMLCRLHRPDWFGPRRRRPFTAKVRSKVAPPGESPSNTKGAGALAPAC